MLKYLVHVKLKVVLVTMYVPAKLKVAVVTMYALAKLIVHAKAKDVDAM